jgi:hypothetical protein
MMDEQAELQAQKIKVAGLQKRVRGLKEDLRYEVRKYNRMVEESPEAALAAGCEKIVPKKGPKAAPAT